eukprot:365622-Chlamydomonas_euryale.AAC.7
MPHTARLQSDGQPVQVAALRWGAPCMPPAQRPSLPCVPPPARRSSAACVAARRHSRSFARLRGCSIGCAHDSAGAAAAIAPCAMSQRSSGPAASSSSSRSDFYAALGLARDCEPDDIRTAFKKLALKHHPVRMER